VLEAQPQRVARAHRDRRDGAGEVEVRQLDLGSWPRSVPGQELRWLVRRADLEVRRIDEEPV